MKRGEVPGGISDAVGGVLAATRALVAAAAAGDTAGIHRAIDRRGTAVERLRRELDRSGDALTETGRHRLLESLAMQAQDAADDLSGLQHRISDDLRAMARGVRAVRGYGGSGPGDPSSLDRAG